MNQHSSHHKVLQQLTTRDYLPLLYIFPGKQPSEETKIRINTHSGANNKEVVFGKDAGLKIRISQL